MKFCKFTIFSLVMFACLTQTLAAQERRPTSYGILYKAWKVEVTNLDDEMPTLTKPEKRIRKQAINQKYTPRFLKLASEHLTDDLWIDCLIWTSVEGTPGSAFDEMFDLLGENAKSAQNTIQLQLLMSNFIVLQSKSIDPALANIVDSHPNSGVRGAALYALASRTKRRAEQLGDVDGCAEAEKLLIRVISDFPNVSTYRGKNLENATALLDELLSPVAITKMAPNAQGTTISGEMFDLTKAVTGKVAVVSFSGHWCGPCVAMHRIQKKLISKYPLDEVVVIEINSDQPEALDDVRKKIKADGLNWLVVTDGRDGPISEQWKVTAWPIYYVIDSNGRIRHRAIGNVGESLVHWVDALIPKSG